MTNSIIIFLLLSSFVICWGKTPKFPDDDKRLLSFIDSTETLFVKNISNNTVLYTGNSLELVWFSYNGTYFLVETLNEMTYNSNIQLYDYTGFLITSYDDYTITNYYSEKENRGDILISDYDGTIIRTNPTNGNLYIIKPDFPDITINVQLVSKDHLYRFTYAKATFELNREGDKIFVFIKKDYNREVFIKHSGFFIVSIDGKLLFKYDFSGELKSEEKVHNFKHFIDPYGQLLLIVPEIKVRNKVVDYATYFFNNQQLLKVYDKINTINVSWDSVVVNKIALFIQPEFFTCNKLIINLQNGEISSNIE